MAKYNHMCMLLLIEKLELSATNSRNHYQVYLMQLYQQDGAAGEFGHLWRQRHLWYHTLRSSHTLQV